MTDAPGNVADYLPRMAALQPDAVAMYFPTRHFESTAGTSRRVYTEMTYRELDERSSRIAAGLEAGGVRKGNRAALMVRPSPELFALTFGMFKAGVVPVMIDPGLGRQGLARCLHRAAPTAFIGIPVAHAARVILGWARPFVRQKITVGRRWFWGGRTLGQIEQLGEERLRAGHVLPETSPTDTAAILFTSGSTGPPKGVVYTHRAFVAQVESIRALFGIEPGEVDLPTFPLFALFDPALGMTTVIPDMDPTRPAEVDPEEVFAPIERFGVTTMFGSPALLRTVGLAGKDSGRQVPGLRRVIAAGAPLPGPTMELWHGMLQSGAEVLPSYGATECLPIACIDSRTIVQDTWPETEKGYGVCVGAPVPTIRTEIVGISDEPIHSWDESLCVPDGAVGEIVVRGPMVTQAYYDDVANTELAKIADGDEVWHRMGDLGWRDGEGRLWFCGRKSQRVVHEGRDLLTVPTEKIFDTVAGVRRTALVGPVVAGEVLPLLCVELDAGTAWGDVLPQLESLRARGDVGHAAVGAIQGFLLHPEFPVDPRHNAKIGRERLTVWAAGRWNAS